LGEVVYQYDDLDRTIDSTSGLNLLCICSEDSFSYLIHAEGHPHHFRVRQIVFDKRYPGFTKPLGYLSEVLRDDHLLFEEFHRKTIAIRGVPFAPVTQDQLAQDSPQSMLAAHTEVGPNDIIYTDVLGETGHVLLFAIPDLLDAEIQMYYKNARIRHSMSSLLCHALSASNESQSTVHANITHRWLEIVIVENQSLKYINHMRWYDQSDIVYYIAALLENLGLYNTTAFEFSGSAYQAQMHDRLIDYLSIQDKQIVRNSIGEAKVLDLMAIGLCE
jgi:Protein of unknown function (DUF3822)